ncbi:MAG: DUF222 domain-containing protein [Acidimicrobiia bacterium]|nr:DUF222 domain-containing protein [Acidimicrobiia bacterium]
MVAATTPAHTAEMLTAEIRSMHDAMLACQAAMLTVIAEYDEAGYYEADGAHCMGDWLTLTLGVTGSTARDWARTAKCLTDLPAVAEAFAEGDLSYDQTRVLARFVTADDDADWAAAGGRHSVDDLNRIARKARPVTAEESQDAHAKRRLDFCWNHDTGMVDVKGHIPEDDGQTVCAALERTVDGYLRARDRTREGREPYAALLADALVELAGLKLGADPDPDRATLIVAVDAQALTNPDSTVSDTDDASEPARRGGWIQGGPAISAETVRRLGCDCRYQTVTFDEYGIAIGLGRTQRSVPSPLSRTIALRDVTCRWPGCDRTRRLRIHHIIHWANGGRTDTDNLCSLCPAHHRLLHEGHYHITGNANTTLTFKRPDTTPIATSRPPPR